jgi:hypothetical protein
MVPSDAFRSFQVFLPLVGCRNLLLGLISYRSLGHQVFLSSHNRGQAIASAAPDICVPAISAVALEG